MLLWSQERETALFHLSMARGNVHPAPVLKLNRRFRKQFLQEAQRLLELALLQQLNCGLIVLNGRFICGSSSAVLLGSRYCYLLAAGSRGSCLLRHDFSRGGA